MTEIILPTDEQVERAARAMCEAYEVRPEERRTESAQWSPITGKLDYYEEETWLEYYWPQCRDSLIILLNQDKILGQPNIDRSANTWWRNVGGKKDG